MVWYVIWYNCVSYVHAHTHTLYKNVCGYVYGLSCVIRIRLQNQKLKMYGCKLCVFWDTQNRRIHYHIFIWYMVLYDCKRWPKGMGRV